MNDLPVWWILGSLAVGVGGGLLIGHRLRTRYAERYNELAARAKAAGLKIHSTIDDLT